jgi:hypothetical protein
MEKRETAEEDIFRKTFMRAWWTSAGWMKSVCRDSLGNFYGGWITSHLKGPFKGAPGTMGW